MKPNFALNLRPDGIVLLHRAKEGWHDIGEVSLADSDWQEKLGFLRKTATALEKNGLCSKLIIPNSQILFTTVTAPGPTDSERHAQISQALDGLTPYAVSDLVFDWSAEDGTLSEGQVHVAAVARETLDEAEAFAVAHDFNPVSFVAIPPEGSFTSEPFFGTTDFAQGLLDGSGNLERDTAIVRVITPAGTALHAVAPRDESPAYLETLLLVTQRLQDKTETAAEPLSPVQPDEETVPTGKEAKDRPVPAISPQPNSDETRPKDTGHAQDEIAPDDRTATKPEDVSAKLHKTDAPIEKTPAREAETQVQPDSASTPPTGTQPEPISFTSRRTDIPTGQPASSRLGILPSHIRATDIQPADPQKPAAVTAPVVPPITSASPEPDTSISEPDAAISTNHIPPASASSSPRLQAQRPEFMRKPPASPFAPAPQTGRTRRTGLILTLLLAVLMVGAAIWVTMFSGKSGKAPPQESRIESGAQPPLPSPIPPAVPSLPNANAPEQTASAEQPPAQPPVLPETPLPPQDLTAQSMGPGTETTPLPTTPARPTMTVPGNPEMPDTGLDTAPDLEAGPKPPKPQPLNQQEAERRYAATGIWQKAPDPLPPPATEAEGIPYIPSVDAELPIQDAAALPDLPDTPNDLTLPRQSAPAPPETRFTLDQRGLVIPSPEGTINPDGIKIFSGAPPRKPPARGDRVPQVAETQPDNRLAGIRPKPRPANLIQTGEKARLGGRTRAQLAGLRPRPRPASAQIASSVSDTPTAQAVARSRIPSHRPPDFAKTVAITRAATPRTSKPAAAVAAAVSRRQTVAPRLPTQASVAKRATVVNAINLRRVNLIGVYGSPSKRRALIRLPSGRYVKVKVGDRVDGGKVAAIGENSLRYIKGGRNITLKMPKT